MIDLEGYLLNEVKKVIDTWDLHDAYSVTFFVYANDAYEYKNISNITQFNISYNTETYYERNYDPDEDSHYRIKPDKYHSMQRWEYAYLQGKEEKILNDKNYELLFDWYEQEGIINIGFEDEKMFDECTGPIGYQEVLKIITIVAKRLQEEEYLKEKCGRYLPIIIQDYELSDCVIEATKQANVHGEANVFLESI